MEGCVQHQWENFSSYFVQEMYLPRPCENAQPNFGFELELKFLFSNRVELELKPHFSNSGELELKCHFSNSAELELKCHFSNRVELEILVRLSVYSFISGERSGSQPH